MRLFVLSFSIAAISASAVAQTPGPKRPELPEIVQFMLRSLPTWKFSGTRIVEVRSGASRNTDREHIIRDGMRSRTFFPRDSVRYGEVIVETPRERRHFVPSKNTIFVSRGQGMGTDRIGLLARKGGKFVDEKADRVADRDARVVAISDDKNRVQQRIWIDAKTGVILKRELYDMAGARESLFEFRTIDYSPTISPNDFTLNVAGAKIATTYDVAKEQGQSIGITPLFLPKEQFPLDTVRIVRSPAGPFLHMTFATEEGLVSLFQAKGKLPTDRMDNGRPNRFTAVTWFANGNSFALIGRGRQEKLERLAKLLGKP